MRYCAREFSLQELQWIRGLIAEDPKRSRLELSRLVCTALKWCKPDGGLKEMSCRVALLRMQKDGLICLPAPRNRNGNGRLYRRRTAEAEPRLLPVALDVQAFSELHVELIATPKQSALWNEYIARYHYLGYKPLPGAQLRYAVRFHCEMLALVGFGASAWKVAARDQFIGWSAEQRKSRLHLVVNNARFLLLPWVQSKNLASKILSLLIKRVSADWEQRYGYRPVLLETFVEKHRFRGIPYKATNWVHVGVTKGRGKLDVKHRHTLPQKDIWLYPLNKDFRRILCS